LAALRAIGSDTIAPELASRESAYTNSLSGGPTVENTIIRALSAEALFSTRVWKENLSSLVAPTAIPSAARCNPSNLFETSW
jgi:hypothetical protein